MEIKISATGSTGNCYFIENNDTSIMVECGIPVKKIKKSSGHRLHEISGCLVSHAHLDHCKAVSEILQSGIPVYMLQAVKNALAIDHYNINIFGTEDLFFQPEQFRIGSFNILAFPLLHKNTDGSDCQNAGFLIQSGCEKLIYITDSPFTRYKFSGFTHVMCEANYDANILEKNIENGAVPHVMKKRLMYSHMEVENTKKFLLANDLSKCQAIYLIHASENNAEPERFKKEIQELTGVPVFI